MPMVVFTVFIMFMIIVFGSIVIRIDNLDRKLTKIEDALERSAKMPVVIEESSE